MYSHKTAPPHNHIHINQESKLKIRQTENYHSKVYFALQQLKSWEVIHDRYAHVHVLQVRRECVLQNHSTRERKDLERSPGRCRDWDFSFQSCFEVHRNACENTLGTVTKKRGHFQGDCLATSRGKLRTQPKFALGCGVNGYLGRRDQGPSYRLSGTAPLWFATVSVCISWDISL